jgi:hypothetical protein
MSKINIKFFNFYILIIFLNIYLAQSQEQNSIPTVEEESAIGKNQKNNAKIEDQKKKDEFVNLMQDFNNEWEVKMIDYNSEYDYTIPLRPRIQEIYYENVTTVPSKFKGAFIISEESTDKIEFIVKDPKNKIIHQATKHHDIFEIPIEIKGTYTIIFNNRISNGNLMITFTMNTGQNQLINAKDLTKTQTKLETLNKVIKKFNLEFKFGHDIHTRRYKSKIII